jgi:hypothetical protein
MKAGFILLTKLLVLTVLYLICFAVISTALFPVIDQPDNEQVNAAGALLVVSFLNISVLAYLICRSHWVGGKLIAAVFVVYFGIATVMSQVETAFFVTRLPTGMLPRIVLTGAILAAVFSPLAVLILGKRKRRGSDYERISRLQMSIGEWVWKETLIIVSYLSIYFTFGYFIAWKNAAVRAYYGGGDAGGFLSQVSSTLRNTPWLLPLQIVRAMLWTALAVLIIRMLDSEWWETGLVVALAFAILMCSQLLIPNPFMPHEVRMVHLLETATSNFLFGCLTVFVLSIGSKSGRTGNASVPAHLEK